MRTLIVTGSLLLSALVPAAAQQPKYGVTVVESKPAALVSAKTYVWTVSQPAADKEIDRAIIAAVDREMAARGFKKLTSGAADVTVTYGSLTRTDVDLKAKPTADGALPRLNVGTLQVDLRDPAYSTTRTSFFRVRMDTPIESDRSKMEATINDIVHAMFEKYPPPPKK
jgi:hypothetical protein